MRIAIVNDLKLATRALCDVIATFDDCEVAWVAEDGVAGVERCAADVPDLVLMDIVMPNMDGVEATRRIMQATPCPILVVTATVEGNLSKVYEALGAGALDAVDGPRYGAGGVLENTEPLARKVRTIRRLQGPSAAPTCRERAPVAAPAAEAGTDRQHLLAIGASTGGPDAIGTLLGGLPETFEAPIVVVQHLDRQFVPGFIEWLGNETGRRVEAIVPGREPEPGVVLVAETNDHLVMGPGGRFRYRVEPSDTPYRPSVDVFFDSLAESARWRGVGVVLTGMGRDGATGLLHLREHGWQTFAQDEATSVVYGMPKAAKEAGGAQKVLPIQALGAAIGDAWVRAAAGTRGNGKGTS
ncbi:MAG: chemotaxis-specific protein-glutamate methyltransferase CheB [Planctomycetota bacterium]|nr:chemotaxis-specific protein-glutamate methyltransferase CheB [Planctomycetota bacterium]